MHKILPRRADVIAQARQHGLRPDEVVFVEIGRVLGLRDAYPNNWSVECGTQYAISRFDFEWCRGLDIEIVADASAGARVLEAIDLIVECRPRNLMVWEIVSGARWWVADILGRLPRPAQYAEPGDLRLSPSSRAVVAA